MELTFIIMCFAFFSLLILGLPIAIVIALTAVFAIYSTGKEPFEVVATAMAQGVDSFALLAIPFFILSGNIMGRGGMASRLIDFASSLVSRLPGGLAYVNTIACMFFGAISGSSVAAVSSIGSFMIPQMEKKGYDKNMATALTVCSATTGMLIPPSNIMIIYSVAVGGLSIGALFLAGILPGVLMGLCLMVVSFFFNRKNLDTSTTPFNIITVWKTFRRAFLSLMLIVIVLGGILRGIFTATEASAIAVLYAFILEVFVYRNLKISQMPEIFSESAKSTAVVMFIIAASFSLSWIMTISNIPNQIAELLNVFSNDKLAMLIVINIILLVVGTFMDMTPAVLIFTPIFLPIVREFGISDIHFGIIMITNLSIGLCTPPVGTCMFVGCGVGKTTISAITPKLLPYFLAMLFALALISFFPELSLFIPELLS